MKLHSNTYYIIPNSSMFILILSVNHQDNYEATLQVAYISETGNVLGTDKLVILKDNIKHWEQIDNIPFIL